MILKTACKRFSPYLHHNVLLARAHNSGHWFICSLSWKPRTQPVVKASLKPSPWKSFQTEPVARIKSSNTACGDTVKDRCAIHFYQIIVQNPPQINDQGLIHVEILGNCSVLAQSESLQGVLCTLAALCPLIIPPKLLHINVRTHPNWWVVKSHQIALNVTEIIQRATQHHCIL